MELSVHLRNIVAVHELFQWAHTQNLSVPQSLLTSFPSTQSTSHFIWSCCCWHHLKIINKIFEWTFLSFFLGVFLIFPVIYRCRPGQHQRKQRAPLSFSSLRAAALVVQLLRAISFINLPTDIVSRTCCFRVALRDQNCITIFCLPLFPGPTEYNSDWFSFFFRINFKKYTQWFRRWTAR